MPSAPPDPDSTLFEWLTPDAGVFFRHAGRLESTATPYQQLEVYDTPALGRMFRLDGANMTSERDEFFYHENVVHPAALAVPDPVSALVIGGGDGGSAEELLKHPSIRRVVVAELDAEVVAMARRRLQAVHDGALDDARVEVRVGDGMAFVRDCTERFDLVVMDLTDPVGPAAALYAAPFFRDIDRILRPEGALTLHLGSPFFHPERWAMTLGDLRTVFAVVRPYFVHVPLYGANWGMACASQRADPLALEPAAVDRLLDLRRIGGLQYYNGDVHRAGFALPNFVRRLAGSVRPGA